jgi:hypothetical protein
MKHLCVTGFPVFCKNRNGSDSTILIEIMESAYWFVISEHPFIYFLTAFIGLAEFPLFHSLRIHPIDGIMFCSKLSLTPTFEKKEGTDEQQEIMASESQIRKHQTKVLILSMRFTSPGHLPLGQKECKKMKKNREASLNFS